jgi:hypothetical protein
MENTYVDDGHAGSNDPSVVKETADQVKQVLPNGGFQLKVTVFSGEAPSEKASSDGQSCTFVGYQWFPKDDYIKLGLGELNFNPKVCGIKADNTSPVNTLDEVEELASRQVLTRRICLSKVCELYDLNGLAEPIKAKLKLDLKPLKVFEYDDPLPSNFVDLWIKNFQLIHGARSLRFP